MTGKPKLLDLFSGAGGCAMGYHRAGFEVVGVDIKPQPHYPFEFHQGDAFEYLTEHSWEFDLFHGSPKCQAFSKLGGKHRANHENQIPALQKAFRATGKPYIIENVEEARGWLDNPMMLCGTMFGLNIYRHRYFENNLGISWPPASCYHQPDPVLISGTTWRDGKKYEFPVATRRKAIGIDWMTDKELDQAIPPAYTEWLGLQALKFLKEQAA